MYLYFVIQCQGEMKRYVLKLISPVHHFIGHLLLDLLQHQSTGTGTDRMNFEQQVTYPGIHYFIMQQSRILCHANTTGTLQNIQKKLISKSLDIRERLASIRLLKQRRELQNSANKMLRNDHVIITTKIMVKQSNGKRYHGMG